MGASNPGRGDSSAQEPKFGGSGNPRARLLTCNRRALRVPSGGRVDRWDDAVAVNGESVHVEKTNQSTAAREAIGSASHAAQPVARGVDRQQRRMLPCGDGTAGQSVSIERGAGVAA
jgi:hypothetical protein